MAAKTPYGWRKMKLGEFVSLQRGHDLPTHVRSEGNVPVLGSFGVTGYHTEARAKGPGVTLGRSGASFGVVSFSPVDYWPLNTALYVTDFHGNDERFAYYLLKTIDFRRFNSGSAQPSLNRNHIHPLPIQVPPLAEQKAIAAILGAPDDKIEMNRRINETLEAMARAMFKSWFVDFDPFRAKMEGREPGLPGYLTELFPDHFENSELGEIPAGWEVRPFSETVTVISGGTPKTSIADYWNGDIPWFSVVDAPCESDVFVIDTEKKITQAGIDASATRILPQGTTIISARGTVGKLALVGVPMAMNQSCYGLQGIEAGPYFTYFATRELVSVLRQHSHGSVFDTITRNTLAGVPTVVPDKSVLDPFERLVAPVMERIRHNLQQSRTLATLRDALLPKLISGEIRVKDAECLTEVIL